jgi:hypothetical protein
MSKASFTQLATASVATGIASLVICAPAHAVTVPAPGGADHGTIPSDTTASPQSGTDWGQLSLYAGGGVVLVGAGAAVATARQRRSAHAAHPA